MTHDRDGELRLQAEKLHEGALAGRFRSFDADGSLAVAVLSGANGTFCSGADLKAMREDPDRASRASPLWTAVRSDRLSSYQQWDQPLADALLTEFRHGMATLGTGELLTGLERYAAGEWRS